MFARNQRQLAGAWQSDSEQNHRPKPREHRTIITHQSGACEAYPKPPMSITDDKAAQGTIRPVCALKVSISLLALTLVAEVIILAVIISSIGNVRDPSTAAFVSAWWLLFLGVVVGVLLFVGFCTYMTFRRHLWALIALVLMSGIALLDYLNGLAQHSFAISPLRYEALTLNAIRLIGLALLFTPRALSWFKSKPA
jgi:hypothetical protein